MRCRIVFSLPFGAGVSAAVAAQVILLEGNANEHATSGVLDIWIVPSQHEPPAPS